MTQGSLKVTKPSFTSRSKMSHSATSRACTTPHPMPLAQLSPSPTLLASQLSPSPTPLASQLSPSPT
eukprot:805172-Prorocentrum_minimum.AAC.1